MKIRHIVATSLLLVTFCTIYTVSAQQYLIPRRDNSESIGDRTHRYKDSYIVKMYTDKIVAGRDGDILLDPDNLTGDLILIYGKWPSSDGSNADFLKTDGSGTLYWGNAASESTWVEFSGSISVANDIWATNLHLTNSAYITDSLTTNSVDVTTHISTLTDFYGQSLHASNSVYVADSLTTNTIDVTSNSTIGGYLTVTSYISSLGDIYAQDGHFTGNVTGTWTGDPIGFAYGGLAQDLSGVTGFVHFEGTGPQTITFITTFDSTYITNGGVSGADLRNDAVDSTKIRNTSVSFSDLTMPMVGNWSQTGNITASGDIYATNLHITTNSAVGIVNSGQWMGTVIQELYGGTGESAYTDGQLLIGSTVSGGLTKATITEGEGIDVANGAGTITLSGEDASTTNKGIASFDSTNFSVSSGAVSLANDIYITGSIASGYWYGQPVTVPYGGTGKSSWFAYAIPQADDTGSDFAQIAIGAAGQYLVVNGGANGYSWVTLAVDSTDIAANSIAASDIDKVNASDLLGTVAFANGGLAEDLSDAYGLVYFHDTDPQTITFHTTLDSTYITNDGISYTDLTMPLVGDVSVTGSISASDTIIADLLMITTSAVDGYYLQSDGSGRATWVEVVTAGDHATTHEPGGGDALTALDSSNVKDASLSGADLVNPLYYTGSFISLTNDIYANNGHFTTDVTVTGIVNADEIRARDANGLKLYDDAGNAGVFIEDGGMVGVNNGNPTNRIDVIVDEDDNVKALLLTNNDIANNPETMRITTAGSGTSLFIDQNGNGVPIEIDNDGSANSLVIQGMSATDLILTKAGDLGVGATPSGIYDIEAVGHIATLADIYDTNIHHSGNVYLVNTTNASKNGIVYKGSSTFLHNFNYGNNGTVTTSGYNTFVGGAGNLTMGSTATNTWESSYNTVVGNDAFTKNTKGHENVGMGFEVLYWNTEGDGNAALGNLALAGNTTGYYNVAVGMIAGYKLLGGATNNTTSNNSVYIGYGTESYAAGQTNEIVIGATAGGAGSNSVTLGNTSITKTILQGVVSTTSDIYSSNLYTTNDVYSNDINATGNITSSIDIYATDYHVTDDIILANTTFANQSGIIYKGSVPFIHNFNYGNNGTVTTLGYNTFVGLYAGNFTMGSTATEVWHSSNNTAVGYGTLTFNQTGYTNDAFGIYSLYDNTIGYQNVALGSFSLENNITGYNNVAVGMNAGRYITGGADNQNANTSIYIGNSTYASAASQSNEIVIGYYAVGGGSNSVVLGNSSITKTTLRGVVSTTGDGYFDDLHTTSNINADGNIESGGNVIVTDATGKIMLEGSTGDTYLFFNSAGGNVELWKNGVLVGTW